MSATYSDEQLTILLVNLSNSLKKIFEGVHEITDALRELAEEAQKNKRKREEEEEEEHSCENLDCDLCYSEIK